MKKFSVFFAFMLIFLISICGCTTQKNNLKNATEGGTNYTYENKSGDIEIDVSKDFSFKVHGETEFWLKPNASVRFYVVFNNLDEDKQAHKYIARVFPSAANFDVMATYKCLHFSTCDSLLSDMEKMIEQPTNPIEINYTRVGLYDIIIKAPENAKEGVYMFNIVACKDLAFHECNQTTTNFGPNIVLIVHVLKR